MQSVLPERLAVDAFRKSDMETLMEKSGVYRIVGPSRLVERATGKEMLKQPEPPKPAAKTHLHVVRPC